MWTLAIVSNNKQLEVGNWDTSLVKESILPHMGFNHNKSCPPFCSTSQQVCLINRIPTHEHKDRSREVGNCVLCEAWVAQDGFNFPTTCMSWELEVHIHHMLRRTHFSTCDWTTTNIVHHFAQQVNKLVSQNGTLDPQAQKIDPRMKA